jgi:hypothetical protein
MFKYVSKEVKQMKKTQKESNKKRKPVKSQVKAGAYIP